MGTFAWWPRLGCLGLGLAAGWLAARAPLRCKAAGLAADAAAAAAACMAAQALLPTPARTAMLYAGLGALWGQGAARPCPRTGAAAACAWLVLYLPFTGALACLGGGALALAAGFPALGAVAVPVAAAPMALLQFGPEGALACWAQRRCWAGANARRCAACCAAGSRTCSRGGRAGASAESAAFIIPCRGAKCKKSAGGVQALFPKKLQKSRPTPLTTPVGVGYNSIRCSRHGAAPLVLAR